MSKDYTFITAQGQDVTYTEEQLREDVRAAIEQEREAEYEEISVHRVAQNIFGDPDVEPNLPKEVMEIVTEEVNKAS